MNQTATNGPSITEQKERTLRAAWVISLWAPIGSGVAFVLGRSTILLADFLRRTSELLALFFAWVVFRKVARGSTATYNYGYGKLEDLSGLLVACIMGFSCLVIFGDSVNTILNPKPRGSMLVGLLVAIGGCIVNGWFWRRNLSLASQESSPLIEAQWRLYRAKALIDLCVVMTLVLSTIFQQSLWSTHIDPMGSFLIAGFLLYSAFQLARSSLRGLLDCALSDSHQAVIQEVLKEHQHRYTSLHGIRSRNSGVTAYVEVFLEFDSNLAMNEVQMCIDAIRSDLDARIPNSHVSIVSRTGNTLCKE
jgi:ferrous-iron efflux pump FieF